MMMHSSACDCEASLCETLRGFSAQHPDSVIYQTSLMSALLSGVYEGRPPSPICWHTVILVWVRSTSWMAK
jgi:hypothetical protein